MEGIKKPTKHSSAREDLCLHEGKVDVRQISLKRRFTNMMQR